MEFDQVVAEDFTTFKPGVVATHVKIEQLLTQIGGGGPKGTEFKNQAMKAAGYKYDPIVGYAKHPDAAAEAFNKIRTVISEDQDKEELLQKLSG